MMDFTVKKRERPAMVKKVENMAKMCKKRGKGGHISVVYRKVLNNIKSGKKTWETRWYVKKIPPYATVRPGDIIWFKTPGNAIEVTAIAGEVIYKKISSAKKAEELWEAWKDRICMPDSWFRNRQGYVKYITFIKLREVREVHIVTNKKCRLGWLSL
ncbi:MAG: ASCH domain-containing protein [bacterium]|nr:ASCH domain-containing protein [bacterium]